VRSRANLQVVVWLGHPQLVEEDLGHVRVVMLTGVNEPLLDPGEGFDCFDYWRGLHKVWACPDNVKKFHQESGMWVETVNVNDKLGARLRRASGLPVFQWLRTGTSEVSGQ